MDIKNIGVFYPKTLRDLPNWVLWKLEPGNDGRLTKVPYNPHYHYRASKTTPKDWSTFDTAEKELSKGEYNGLGFVFTPESGLLFLDLDHCIDDKGMITPFASTVLTILGKGTYIELSQSMHGLHAFGFGEIPAQIRLNENGSDRRIELYNNQFCAMTGRAICPYEPIDKSSEFMDIYNRYKKTESKRTSHAPIPPEIKLNLSDTKIIDKASKGPDGELFRKLMSGDDSDYPSKSEADFKLCAILSFWADRDFDTIERIFYSSGLVRKKWNRLSYRKNTIQRAIDDNTECYSEFVARKNEEEKLFLKDFHSKYSESRKNRTQNKSAQSTKGDP